MIAVTLRAGECLAIMAELDDASVDAIVTDPPYDLTSGKKGGTGAASVNLDSPYGRSRIGTGNGAGGFMGKAWDSTGIAFMVELWAECLRVLKPGGHLLAFGGSRTWHRMAVAIDDAGFEIRDSIAWLYGSGFPKSLDVSKAIDKAAGAEREVVGDKLDRPGYHLVPGGRAGAALGDGVNGHTPEQRLAAAQVTAPATDDARTWQGWGTALKPAFEPIVVARKPLIGTVAANVLAHGTGALNVDGCRIGDVERTYGPSAAPGGNAVRLEGGDGRDAENARRYAEASKALPPTVVSGRWPANVVLDESQAADLDEQSGTLTSGAMRAGTPRQNREGYSGPMPTETASATIGDRGGASRFFYVAKAPKKERPRVNDVAHPTVKPLTLMRWLVRLVTPPGGLVLDPFAGSGTTVEACMLEGFDVYAIERELDYIPLIAERIARNREAAS